MLRKCLSLSEKIWVLVLCCVFFNQLFQSLFWSTSLWHRFENVKSMWSLLCFRWQLCVEKTLPILCKWTSRRQMVKVTWLTPVLFSTVLCPVNQICCKIFNDFSLLLSKNCFTKKVLFGFVLCGACCWLKLNTWESDLKSRMSSVCVISCPMFSHELWFSAWF